jgi:hypothetical protein
MSFVEKALNRLKTQEREMAPLGEFRAAVAAPVEPIPATHGRPDTSTPRSWTGTEGAQGGRQAGGGP